jgi:hypothetical protein
VKKYSKLWKDAPDPIIKISCRLKGWRASPILMCFKPSRSFRTEQATTGIVPFGSHLAKGTLMAESQLYFSLILFLIPDLLSNYCIWAANSLDGGVLAPNPEVLFVESITMSFYQWAENMIIPFGFLGKVWKSLVRDATTHSSLPLPPPWKMNPHGMIFWPISMTLLADLLWIFYPV